MPSTGSDSAKPSTQERTGFAATCRRGTKGAEIEPFCLSLINPSPRMFAESGTCCGGGESPPRDEDGTEGTGYLTFRVHSPLLLPPIATVTCDRVW